MAEKTKTTIWTRNFICVLFTNCLLVMSSNSVNTMVSTYTTYLGAGPRLMGLLTGLFFAVALAMRPVAGPVTTRIDNRKLMMLVYAIGCFVNLGYAVFHSIPMFLIFRILNGVEYAFVGSLGMTIAADSLPKEKLSSGLGIYGVSGAIATSIAPQVAIWLRDWGTALRDLDLGYTFVFLFAAICLGLGVVASYLMNPDHKDKDVIAGTGKWYQTIISKYAIFPAVLMLLMIISYSLFSAYMVPFGEEIGVKNVGIFFTVLSIGMLASRPISGSLSDKLGTKIIFIPAAILFALCFIVLGSAGSVWMIAVAALIAAVGYGAMNPIVQSLCMQTETRARRAVASNTLFVGMDVGFFVGPLIGGFIVDLANYRTVMYFGIVPVVLGLLAFFIGWRACARRVDEVKALENQ